MRKWYNPSTWNYPRAYGAMLALIVFIGIVVVVVVRSGQTREIATKNQEAIEKGCTLLNNAIITSTQAQADPESPTSALITGILEVIPKKYVILYAERSKKNPFVVPLINCRRVAEHPEDIRAVPVKKPTP